MSVLPYVKETDDTLDSLNRARSHMDGDYIRYLHEIVTMQVIDILCWKCRNVMGPTHMMPWNVCFEKNPHITICHGDMTVNISNKALLHLFPVKFPYYNF